MGLFDKEIENNKDFKNSIYYGDNLELLKKIPNNYVDLIYLDPPFNSNRNYNKIYSLATGHPVPEEAIAFCDAWTLNEEKEEELRNFEITLIEEGADPDFIKVKR